MTVLEIDTSRVRWPETPVVKAELRDYIRKVAKEEGYMYFATLTFRCLNGIEDPDPDPFPPPGWQYLSEIFHDCEPERVDVITAVYPNVRVVARKDAP